MFEITLGQKINACWCFGASSSSWLERLDACECLLWEADLLVWLQQSQFLMRVLGCAMSKCGKRVQEHQQETFGSTLQVQKGCLGDHV